MKHATSLSSVLVLIAGLASMHCGVEGAEGSGGTDQAMSQDVLVSDSGYYPDVSPSYDPGSPNYPDFASDSGAYDPHQYNPGWDVWQSDPGGSNETGIWIPPEGCTPYCDGMQCGPDGCGGACGWCPGMMSCHDGLCVEVEGCMPHCTAKMVGEEDGCGGVCSGSGMSIGLKPGGAQDAGYFRSLVNSGQVPSPDLLPVEGWLNEHDTPLPDPDYSQFLTLHAFLGLFYNPLEGKPVITMQLGMNSGIDPQAIEAGTFNLCVVLDRSGSMQEADKIDYAKEGLKLMIDALDEDDTLSIVTYSTDAKVLIAPAKVGDKEAIKAKIDSIVPGGSTNLYHGMALGYQQVAQSMSMMPAAQHRVLLITDGLVNHGETVPANILAKSKEYNEAGIGITTIGVGQSFNFDLMYDLANQGGGNFYFLDSGEKLADVFTEEIKYLLTPLAKDLFISFRLSDGFAPEAIYGFEFNQLPNGDVVLLGPTQQYTLGPGQPPPENPPDVAVSTVFASKKNGIIMVNISGPDPDVLASFANIDFATVSYQYTLIAEESVEMSYETALKLDGVHSVGEGSYEYFTDNIVRRNFCLLRMALSMKQACQFYEDSLDAGQTDKEELIGDALAELSFAETFCDGVYFQLKNDGWTGDNVEGIKDDLELLAQLQTNICTLAECVQPVE